MAKIYYQHDCNLDYLKKKTVAIIGYGRAMPTRATCTTAASRWS